MTIGTPLLETPNRKSLWILSRTSLMKDITYQQITSRIKENGFDISKIVLTNQNINLCSFLQSYARDINEY